MTQDKAHPTPPAVPSEWKAFEAWAREHLGRGYSLAMDDGVYLHPVTRWAFKAYKAGRAAPVASNTTAEPAPIQPAGVEVERDAARYRAIESSGRSGTIRIDDEFAVCPRYIHWGGATGLDLGDAIDQALAGGAAK